MLSSLILHKRHLSTFYSRTCNGGSLKRLAFSSIAEKYRQLIQDGTIQDDIHQVKFVKLLDKLRVAIESFDFDSLGPSSLHSSAGVGTEEGAKSSPARRLRGVYMFGNVGTGKTMLMNLLFDECQVKKKRKVHFHQFMLEVHRRIHEHKQQLLQQYGRQRHINLSSGQDSIRVVAQQIADESHLLCFDEFQVTDICDAVIVTRLLDGLWSRGVVLVATSNRPPDDLYLNGMNRPDFLPFIERLKQECIVRQLASGKDYRVLRYEDSLLTSSEQDNTSLPKVAYFSPTTQENIEQFTQSYREEVQRMKETTVSIRNVSFHRERKHNHIVVPITGSNRFLELIDAEPNYGIGLVDFQQLCHSDRGAADFHALGATFHTIYLQNIPQLSKDQHNAARRFITLIDELYNANIRLVCLAEAPQSHLFEDITKDANESQTATPSSSAESSDDLPKYGRNYQPGI